MYFYDIGVEAFHIRHHQLVVGRDLRHFGAFDEATIVGMMIRHHRHRRGSVESVDENAVSGHTGKSLRTDEICQSPSVCPGVGMLEKRVGDRLIILELNEVESRVTCCVVFVVAFRFQQRDAPDSSPPRLAIKNSPSECSKNGCYRAMMFFMDRSNQGT